MAAFIVISTDNKLHDLVDDIEKCRPRNPHVETYISTGKIIRTESGEYTYRYTIAGEVEKNEEKVSLADLLSNQLARFRKVCCISKAAPVNVFLLGNPLNEGELKQELHWLSEFESIYEEGQGKDTGFRLFRILFTYDVAKPTDVCTQMRTSLLKEILDTHRSSVDDVNQGVKKMFNQFIFYIDNQNSDAAALCLSKEDHNLMLPRYLVDVMMLISNPNDSYGVINSITNASCSTRCFSVGYAECMYYYPDVESYLVNADQKALLYECLFGEDEVFDEEGKKVMDVDKFPFGLLKRKKRLEEIYSDVPFSEDIRNYPLSVDKAIDDKLILLKDYLEAKRQEDLEEFEHSDEIVEKEKELALFEDQRDALINDKALTEEEFRKKSNEISEKIKQIKRSLEEKRMAFRQQCCFCIDRKLMYQNLCVVNNDYNNEGVQKDSAGYKKTLDYVCSKDFLDYVNKHEVDSVDEQNEHKGDTSESASSITSDNRKGCLGWLFFWVKDKENFSEIPVENEKANQENSPTRINASDLIVEIKEMLDLKRCYAKFADDVARVNASYSEKKRDCDEFKLTAHSNSCCPLIDLEKLQKLQRETYKDRFEECQKEWNETEEKTLESLKSIMKEKSLTYADRYSFIDWSQPFPFVKTLSVMDGLPKICNKLQALAAPFVNYNLTTAEKENKVVLALYTDMPTIAEDFKKMKGLLNNGTAISVYRSSHIESKICMMQFLPMDDEVLENLVDLQDSNLSTLVLDEEKSHLSPSVDSEQSALSKADETADSLDTIDWGNH